MLPKPGVHPTRICSSAKGRYISNYVRLRRSSNRTRECCAVGHLSHKEPVTAATRANHRKLAPATIAALSRCSDQAEVLIELRGEHKTPDHVRSGAARH